MQTKYTESPKPASTVKSTRGESLFSHLSPENRVKFMAMVAETNKRVDFTRAHQTPICGVIPALVKQPPKDAPRSSWEKRSVAAAYKAVNFGRGNVPSNSYRDSMLAARQAMRAERGAA